MDFLLMVILATVIFFVIDIIWLGVIAKELYNREMGSLLKEKVNWVAAIVFYLIFVVGMVFFAIAPAVDQESLGLAFGYGGALGLLCYATYDLTNLATMKNFPLKITIIDLIWGTSLGALTSGLTYIIFMLFQ